MKEMTTNPKTKDPGQAAIIYCRVSTTRQKLEGGGLDSQEHRCRQYAQDRGYTVEAVFPDDTSGGGDFMKRPGMVALLAFLDAQKDRSFVVIFDDPKRFARDTEFHIKLRREFAERRATIECLNFNFEDTPEGRFIETIIAAQGQLEREQNKRQVIQKMKARVEKGYSVFHPPIGYRYQRDRIHGKILVRDEPVASIVAEALEGFADGRFRSQAEVKRFLESKPAFPKGKTTGEVTLTKILEMLQRPTYAGYVEAPKWGVSLRRGHHEPLISLDMHERIQEILKGKARGPTRADTHEDFPLRGFVLCNECGEPMTACWSKGRSKHYAYYLCDTRDCSQKRKSIPRAKIEDGARDILRAMQPSPGLFNTARAMFRDAWELHLAEGRETQKRLEDELKATQAKLDSVLDLIVEAGNASTVAAFEQKIEKLEREKNVLTEKIQSAQPARGRLNEFIEPLLGFLLNPWNIYKNGGLHLKRVVLKLAFAQPLRYDRNEGYRTAEISFPFKVLDGALNHSRHSESGLVGGDGLEPPTHSV
ncbi:recombinase family protein [Pontivivens ytuae]|uniref:Recombinase family protein n=1 Tax=Pontivivens ytuae TaxID=2789856 RepID=A0A7S9LVH6_9RHOB|nr:recombinase family protein [Pontivivens ytuae]